MTERLLDIRQEIDRIDENLIALLAERFVLTAEVGQIKRQAQLPPIDPIREAAQMHRITNLADEHDLDPVFAQKVLRLIIDEVVRLHQKI
jgi:chorismate mutase